MGTAVTVSQRTLEGGEGVLLVELAPCAIGPKGGVGGGWDRASHRRGL